MTKTSKYWPSKLRSLVGSTALLGALAFSTQASAFCGFYVAKADTGLFNESSKVVLVRDGDRTVITMANDYQGDPTEFAMVIPVPTVITKQQVHVSKTSLLDHIDAYTAPRLVEYFDDNPCEPRILYDMAASSPRMMQKGGAELENEDSHGVTIEESFSVGEYDILILSAKESGGLQTWLTSNGYKIPDGAGKILSSYIKQDMKFFVAKVNLKEKAKIGGDMLRPIAVAFESPKFMLPIRLGTVNSKGTQDMFVYTLTKNGRVETTNYRTQKIPSDKEIPVFVKGQFGDFYKDMYAETARKEGGKGVFMEYAWDMGWCDPCAADPLSSDQLRELGVFWLDGDRDLTPTQRKMMPPRRPQAQNVFVTRLHIRYDKDTFPEDLKFHQTGDRSNFQGRYILRHPYKGEMRCDAALEYKKAVNTRIDKEIKTLASLTGWERSYIRAQIDEDDKGKPFDLKEPTKKSDWWHRIWPGND
ncbi:MAG: DUF2330 domain-containing protein [Robiginitomaculum sp.]|nr:DUF2330 domain-containing protein [Robiginitomaculum sp.]